MPCATRTFDPWDRWCTNYPTVNHLYSIASAWPAYLARPAHLRVCICVSCVFYLLINLWMCVWFLQWLRFSPAKGFSWPEIQGIDRPVTAITPKRDVNQCCCNRGTFDYIYLYDIYAYTHTHLYTIINNSKKKKKKASKRNHFLSFCWFGPAKQIGT